MAKSLAEQMIELPDDPSQLSESDQVRLIRKLDKRQRKLAEQLRGTEKALHQAEREIENLEDFEGLIEETHGKASIRHFKAKRKRPSGSATAVLCATDWHSEENIEAATIGGLNSYNIDIAQRRIETAFTKYVKMIDFASSLSKIRDVVLWLGGDLINGYIHEELEESNFLGPAEAIQFVQDQIASGVKFLLKETNLPITIVTNYGNHGRSTKRRRVSTGYKTSWEWLAYNSVAKFDGFASEPRVHWKIEKGYFNWLDIEGHPFRFHHGDGLKYNGGVGGITIPVNKAIAQWNKSKRARFDVFGHYHQYIYNWNWLAVGCLCGYNAYAESIKADYQPPTQAFMTVDKEYGPVLALPVFVEKAA